MIVNDEKKLIFIHIPKNGGSSVKKLFETDKNWKHIFHKEPELWKEAGFYHSGHLEAEWLRKYPKYDGYETISISRNPWSRQLSIYMFWINQMRIIMAGEYPQTDILKANPNAYTPWIQDYHVKLITGGFHDWIHEDKTDILDIGPYYKWADEERKAKHHWFKLESEEELAQLCELLGVSMKVGKENVTQHLPYTEYYRPEMIEIVRVRYEQDIKRFGYEFGQ